MKRSALRRRAKKAKSWKNPAMLAEFRDVYPEDQVEHLLCGPTWDQVKSGYVRHGTVETNHIFRGGKRADLWCNLVRMTSRAHHYFHRDSVGGIVACMVAVLRRENDACRVRAEWAEAFGRDPIGWLSAKLDAGAVPEQYRNLAEGVINTLKGGDDGDE